MNMTLYDYLRANPQAFQAGIGQPMGQGSPGVDDLSRNAYGQLTGDWSNSGPDSPAYQAWVLSKIPQNWKDDMMANNRPENINIATMQPNGSINVPEQILGTNLDDSGFLGISNDFWKPAGIFASLIGGAGMLNGGFGGFGGGAASGAGGAMDMGVGLQGWMDSLGASASGLGEASGGVNSLADNWDLFGAGNSATNPFGGSGGSLPYGDAIEGLIDLTNKGMSGEQAVQTLTQMNPNWTQSTLQFLTNNPSQLFGGQSGGSLAQTLGKLISTGLGVYGANKQTDSLNSLSQQFAGYGAPYRARLAASYADPAGFLANSPDIQAAVGQGTDALARSLSTQGNPAGSGRALQELQSYATTGLYGKLGQERDRLAGFGGLTAYNQAAPQAAVNAVNSEGNSLNAIGAGINSIMSPQKTTYQTMMDFFNTPGVA